MDYASDFTDEPTFAHAPQMCFCCTTWMEANLANARLRVLAKRVREADAAEAAELSKEEAR